MPRAVEQSHRIAEIAIGALKQLSLAATPRNIEVWYAILRVAILRFRVKSKNASSWAVN